MCLSFGTQDRSTKCGQDRGSTCIGNTARSAVVTIPHLEQQIEYKRMELAWLEAGAPKGKEPWREWQVQTDWKWFNLSWAPEWIPHQQYRRKPRMLSINGREFPEPMRAAPEVGTWYWYANPFQDSGVGGGKWEGIGYGKQWLERGLCHATEEAARQHFEAI